MLKDKLSTASAYEKSVSSPWCSPAVYAVSNMYDKGAFKDAIANANISDMRDIILKLQKKLKLTMDSTDNIFDKYVSLHDEYVSDVFAEELYKELYIPQTTNMSPKSPHVVWYGDKPYKYSGHDEHPANPINPNSALKKFVDMANADLSLDRALSDGVIVSIYYDNECSLGMHCDDERIIDSCNPVYNLSLGDERTSTLTKKGSNPSHNTRRSTMSSTSMTLKHKSLQVMHPGCQVHLLHGIPSGCNNGSNQRPRISISGRKLADNQENKDPQTEPIKCSTPISVQSGEKTTLLLGTSITRPLIGDRMGRNGNKCINISQGGAKINDVKTNLSNFNKANKEKVVDKLIFSLGTNDIRNIRDVTVLEEPLEDLVKATKSMYPQAEIYAQSLLPIRLSKGYNLGNLEIVDKCYSFNRLLFKLCKKYNIYYVDLFKQFLTPGKPGTRDIRDDLYIDQVHLSTRGVSVIARRFTYIVNKHSLLFHPTRF